MTIFKHFLRTKPSFSQFKDISRSSSQTQGVFKACANPGLNNVLTISQFIQAFGMYKNIMCKAHPHRRQELDLYERDILDMSSRFGGSGFYEYHKTFSAQAASHLRYNSVKVDWSVRNNTLYCSILPMLGANSCANCGSTVFTCHRSARLSNPVMATSAGSGSNVSSPSSWNVVHPANRASVSRDILGRSMCVHNGSEVCNNFNSVRGCQWVKCRNLHICVLYKGFDHSKVNCKASTNW